MSRLSGLAVVLITVALLAVGCESTAPSRPAASVAPSGAPASPSASEAPASEAPPGSAIPSGAPTPAPGSTALPSGGTGGAADCSGSLDNRTFFESVAGEVTWAVYCAVLPDGWFVDTGNFTLRDGGQMDVAYKGPNGARFVLEEGSFCTSGVSACSPRNQSLGATPFGDLSGELVTLGGPADGFAVYVSPGVPPSWSATGTGMDQATFVSYVAALHRVQP